MPLKERLAVWTCAVMAAGAVLRPAAARAQPYVPYPPYGVYPIDVGNSSARLQVTPKATEVYVDGHFAGKVDDFDGFGQKLHLEAGGHEIALYLEGYRTQREKLHFQPGSTYKIKWTMEKLGAGETSGPRPQPLEPPRRAARATPRESLPPAPPSERPPDRSAFGTLSLRVQPSDATVLIDGERWEGPDPGRRLAVQVSKGRHRVEIRKDGYQPFETSVRVFEGEVTPLNVSLPPLEPQ